MATLVAHHPTLSHTLRFLSTTAGRDKLLRLLQYTASLTSAHLSRTLTLSSTHPSLLKSASTTRTQFGLIRKALRLGKWIEHFQLAARAYLSTSDSDSILRFLSVLRQLFYGVYLLLDNVHFPVAAKIYTPDPESAASVLMAYISRLSLRAWILGISTSLLAQMYKLAKFSYSESLTHRSETKAKERLAREKSAVREQILVDVCDLTIPGRSLGVLDISEYGVAVAGVVGSVVGVQREWGRNG